MGRVAGQVLEESSGAGARGSGPGRERERERGRGLVRGWGMLPILVLGEISIVPEGKYSAR